MRRIDNYPVEVLISIALAMGTHLLASLLHASGPIAVVVAGLIIGNKGPADAMSDQTQRYLFGYWTLVDEILNMLLFLLMGLEVLVLRFEPSLTLLAVFLLPVIFLARLLATAIPVGLHKRWQSFVPGTVAILTWCGLRGAISIVLALSLPKLQRRPSS
jgi:CPA1 family monovalent cation:H+ antiporter